NSATWPFTRTASPTATVGAALVKTKMASEVAGSASGSGSWRKKPLPVRAVTMPATLATAWPTFGERWAAPWISGMRTGGGVGGGGGEGGGGAGGEGEGDTPPLLRGVGAPAVKSAALLSVSVLPLPARSAAVVLARPGAGPPPSKLEAVPP